MLRIVAFIALTAVAIAQPAQANEGSNAVVRTTITPGSTQTSNGPGDNGGLAGSNSPAMLRPLIYPSVSCFTPPLSSRREPAPGTIDPDCVKREYIRLAYAMGMLDRALVMWCKQPAVWADFGTVDECLAFQAIHPEPLRTEPMLSAYTTAVQTRLDHQAQELQEIENRLNANAAAERAKRRKKEVWKAELAQKYIAKEATE